MKKHPIYMTSVLAAFLGLLLLPMAGQKTQTEKKKIKIKPVAVKLDTTTLDLRLAVPLKIEPVELKLEPAVSLKIDAIEMELKPAVALAVDANPVILEVKPLTALPPTKEIQKAVSVSTKIRKKIQKELRTKTNVNVRTKLTIFSNPVPGARFSSGYGERMHPTLKKIMKHNGVDLAAKTGTPIFAAADGTVIEAVAETPDNTYGYYVIIAHSDGFETFYSSMDKVHVIEGQQVNRGDTIGQVGQTGQAVGSHLHFELRKDGKAVDPADFIEFKK